MACRPARLAAGLLLVAAVVVMMASGAQALRIEPEQRLTEKDLTGLLGQENGVPIVDPPTRVAGYFKLDRTKAAEMFYFFFQARRNAARAPVVLWMTGGPGCSSELAILYENGPYTLDKAGTSLTETQYGWDASHNMIFVDQPIGTGFSYSDDPADTVYGEKGVADDMLDFLHNFFAAHPELADLPLYITGESYAGHYVPAVSHRVYLSNKNKEGPYINLQGLAIGNGLTEPTIQFQAYGDFALQNNLISKPLRTWMGVLYPLCKLANSWCEATNWDWVCALGLNYCMLTQFQPILAANPDINVYDITKKCDGHLCYDFSAADKFLNSAAIRKQLGVGDREWVSCDMDVYMDFAGDWLHRYDTILPEMMYDGIRVMIYAGDLDLICNWVGNRGWVDALDWDGQFTWITSDDEDWTVQGKTAGKAKELGPLTFVQVFQAGHMVPMDQPLNALAMISTWTRNMSLVDSPHAHHHLNDPALHTALDAATERLMTPRAATVASRHTPVTSSDSAGAHGKPCRAHEAGQVESGEVGTGGVRASHFVRAVMGKVTGMMQRAQEGVARKLRAM